MKTVIITRKWWGWGSLRVSSGNDEDKRCCLGFCSESYGVSPSQTKGVGLPAALSEQDKMKLPNWLCDDSGDVGEAMIINDSVTLSDEEKEKLLKPIFAKHGIRLIFWGKR